MSFDAYNLARALHILAVIAWMAGMLMLPRFYAYQTESEPGGELDRKMIEAAGKLRSIILTPAMVTTWILGLYLVASYHREHLLAFWLVAKVSLVLAMSGLHGFYVAQGRKLARGERPRSAKFWRMINEVPFLLAIAIVLLVTLKPS
jgi:putative membrane protein